MNGVGQFVVEKAFDYQSTSDVIDYAKKLISSFSSSKINQVLERKKHSRFFAYSVNDFSLVDDFINNTKVGNLILPDFLAYGRDQKIESIIKKIHEYSL
jgi:hypothetical protein